MIYCHRRWKSPPRSQPSQRQSQPKSPSISSNSSSSTSTTTSTTTRQPLVSIKGASTTAPRVAQPVQQHARTNSLGSETSASSRFSAELIRQYATYFQSTTPRPPRGPLPTLTPFPRFIKN
ncbi:probable serine/threonine-protein kinase mkcB isoform X3 [Drosophila navojoa]|uniref:probable serine/threonine-protein kinase mkcB isoform X3 n=1 Tax=Drosophila navojoa TaxID=7232 RepID=UPI0008472BAB|nr:probable serine/threonine-protein kinase mkcB isoform X3 [Drosophila navojoa]